MPDQLAEVNRKFMYCRIRAFFNPSGANYLPALEWLEVAGVIIRCFNVTEPKLPLENRIRFNNFKVYLNDTGLLASRYPRDMCRRIVAGDPRAAESPVVENAVACCLEKCGHRAMFFKTGSREVDFVTMMNLEAAAIDVRPGSNHKSKPMKSFGEKYKVKRLIEFEKTNIEVTEDGIEHYPLFCCAFMDSLEKEVDLKVEMVDVEKLNNTIV